MPRPPDDSPELSHIVPDLRRLAVAIDSVIPDPANVRMHPERNLRAVSASLRRFQQRKPIVVNKTNGVIEAGNGTVECALSLGWKWVAAVMVEDDPATATGFAIADNRTAEMAHWDYAGLARMLSDAVGDIPNDELGFTDEDLAALAQEFAAAGDGAQDPNDIGDYDEEQDHYLVKIQGVKRDEARAVLDIVREAVRPWSLKPELA